MMRQILVLFACLFLGTAQAAPATTAYDVEVLVFENRLPNLEGGEFWTRSATETPNPDLAGAVSANYPAPADAAFLTAVTALQNDGSYRVLMHQRWRQAAEEKSATAPVRLRNPDGQLDGTLRFYMSRFLHVDMDLTLQDREAAAGGLNYRLQEHRRVKTQETNYFDHPKLGVLVRVTAVGKE